MGIGSSGLCEAREYLFDRSSEVEVDAIMYKIYTWTFAWIFVRDFGLKVDLLDKSSEQKQIKNKNSYELKRLKLYYCVKFSVRFVSESLKPEWIT